MLILVGVVALQPADFRVSRSAVMAAPPAEVFAQVNDFHAWQAWSPWAKLDPQAKATFEGPESGKARNSAWDGNREVGKGQMTILESKPDELVRIRLDFERPMQNTCTAEFTFKPADDGTQVAWSMSGRNNFLGRAVCMFMNMDKMVGGQFENGLQSLKEIVEAKEKPEAAE